jgi:hypothetical protein
MRVIGTHRGVELVESPAADGPLALGLWRRRIVVPGGFEARYAPAERQLALDHERYHHARGDILANHIALIVLAATWFNPVSWIAFRAFRADQELSCDAAIAAEAQDRAEPKEQRRVTIIERSTGGDLKPGERREFRLRPGETGDVIYRGFTPEMQARLSKCPEAREHLANPESRSEGRTKIILCGENGPMNDVDSLQRARERIARELTGERRERILAEIDAAIARARKP